MESWLSVFLDKFAPGLLSILGVIVGARLSSQLSSKQTRIKALRESYSLLFSCFYTFMNEKDIEHLPPLVAACEQTRLICSPSSESLIILLEGTFLSVLLDPPETKATHAIIARLRLSAKEDLASRKFSFMRISYKLADWRKKRYLRFHKKELSKLSQDSD